LTIRAAGLAADIVNGLDQWGDDIRVDGEALTMTIRSELDLPAINRYLVSHDVQVYALTPNRVSLEEIFIDTLGEDGGL